MKYGVLGGRQNTNSVDFNFAEMSSRTLKNVLTWKCTGNFYGLLRSRSITRELLSELGLRQIFSTVNNGLKPIIGPDVVDLAARKALTLMYPSGQWECIQWVGDTAVLSSTRCHSARFSELGSEQIDLQLDWYQAWYNVACKIQTGHM